MDKLLFRLRSLTMLVFAGEKLIAGFRFMNEKFRGPEPAPGTTFAQAARTARAERLLLETCQLFIDREEPLPDHLQQWYDINKPKDPYKSAVDKLSRAERRALGIEE